MGTKEHMDQRFRVLSPSTITWPPSSEAATVNWSAGRKLLAFYGESLWLPRNSPLTSFTLFCSVLPAVLGEILYLTISNCTLNLNESILFFSLSETYNPAPLQSPNSFWFSFGILESVCPILTPKNPFGSLLLSCLNVQIIYRLTFLNVKTSLIIIIIHTCFHLLKSFCSALRSISVFFT